ncbi:HNH endonuclease [Pseudomonas oryzihabitans]|uniref:HNH endonuclease n=1 Tax=Pseudomonas oryzihabitans TaxID=47885 RepID=A0A1G5MZ39_9PSED|nr:HNH endonuclease signature motif containing protein [Pseudomonas psychrotolerans]NMY90052.1 HNH endonuclease [Pseudomonas psychrotolerans]SCZ30376.1 HNH endonuclease [Pseudomonas psychrotolerans]
MNFYWVNVGKTFNEALLENFLWAPIQSKSKSGKAKKLRHWEVVSEITRGDVIFCAYNRHLTKVAIAVSDAYPTPRPTSREFKEWNNEGNRVDVTFNNNTRAVLKKQIAEQFLADFNDSCDPPLFNQSGGLNQIYMSKLSNEAGQFLLEATNTLGDFIDKIITEGSIKTISETTRETIILARVGQGRFREDLLNKWSGKCCLTGLDMPNLLVASHIVPWASSTNKERLDFRNGLLLSPHIDRLFDSGLISFADDGKVLISNKLKKKARLIFGLSEESSIGTLHEETRNYMKRHRQKHRFEE